MRTTADYLDALRVRFAVPSDYALRAATGWSRQQTSRYRQRKTTFDDDTSGKVAGWLSIELAVVLIDMNAQRAKRTEVKRAWSELAKKAGALAAGVLIAFAVVPLFNWSSASSIFAQDSLSIIRSAVWQFSLLLVLEIGARTCLFSIPRA